MNKYRVYFRNIEVMAQGINEYNALISTGLFKDNVEHLKTYIAHENEKRPAWIFKVFMGDTKGLELVVIERI